MRFITVQDTMYLVKSTIPAETKKGYDVLKREWNADAILRNGNTLYLCQLIIDAEFEDK